jgi:hypothetical protein
LLSSILFLTAIAVVMLFGSTAMAMADSQPSPQASVLRACLAWKVWGTDPIGTQLKTTVMGIEMQVIKPTYKTDDNRMAAK